MVVTNTTKIEADDAINMLTKSTKKLIKSKFPFAIVVLICGLLILIMGLTSNKGVYNTFGSVFVAFTIVYFIWILIQLSKARTKVINNNSELAEMGITYNYTFREQSFEIQAVQGAKSDRVRYDYKLLNKVYERNNLYELKVDKTNIFYVYKDGFKSEEMHKFFIRNIEKANVRLIKTKK